MTCPRDDSGRPLPAAWRRLSEAPALELAGVLAISADRRACFLDHKRKLELARKAINHVVDGDAVPKSVEGGGVVWDCWRAAVEAVKEKRREGSAHDA